MFLYKTTPKEEKTAPESDRKGKANHKKTGGKVRRKEKVSQQK